MAALVKKNVVFLPKIIVVDCIEKMSGNSQQIEVYGLKLKTNEKAFCTHSTVVQNPELVLILSQWVKIEYLVLV